jgi:hypothetical protein
VGSLCPRVQRVVANDRFSVVDTDDPATGVKIHDLQKPGDFLFLGRSELLREVDGNLSDAVINRIRTFIHTQSDISSADSVRF